MLEAKNVIKSYGNFTLDINVGFSRGEIVGLFGANGAGKTTLFRCLLGLVPYKGEVLLDGHLITDEDRSHISLGSSEHTFFGKLTARDHKEFYEMNFPCFNKKRFDLLLEFFELPPNKQLRHLSQGQQNQIETILALSQGADYILLDEPFAGNDIFNRDDFYKVLVSMLEPTECIVLSTHLIEEIRNFVSRAVLLKSGALVGDKTMEQLDEGGTDLVQWIKETYNREGDRVSKIIAQMEKEQ